MDKVNTCQRCPDKEGEHLIFRNYDANDTDCQMCQSLVCKQDALLASLLDTSSDAIGMFNLDGTILSWNKGAESLYGLPAGEMIGKNIAELVPPNRLDDYYLLIPEIRQGKNIHGIETQYLKPDGSRIDIFLFTTPLKNTNGECDSFLFVGHDNTERKKHDALVKENESILKEAQQLAQIGSWKFEFSPQNLIWSEELYRILELDNIITKPSFDNYLAYVHPEDRTRVREAREAFKESHKDGESNQSIHRLLMGDGRIKFIHNITRTTFDQNGQPVATYSTFQDVTSLHEAQRNLAQAEERFSAVANDAGEWIWEMDANGLYTYSSPACFEIFGLTPEEIVHKIYFYDLIKDEFRKLYTKLSFQALYEKRRVNKSVHQIVLKDGRIVYLETTGSQMFDVQGKISGYRGISLNVTEQVIAQEALKKSEETFRLLAENVSDVIWTLDIECRFLYVSPSVKRLLGFSPDEVINQTFTEYLTPDSADVANQALRDSMIKILTGEPVPPITLILEQPCKDGEKVWTEATISSIFDENKNFIFFLGVTRDISRRKEIEDQLVVKEAAIQSSISAIALTDPNGITVYVNSSFVKMWGFMDEKDILGINFVEFFDDKDRYRLVRESIIEGKSIYTDAIGKKQDRTSFDILISVNPVYNKENILTHYMASVVDNTERKKSEQELHNTNDRLEMMIQSGNIGLWNHNVKTGESIDAIRWQGMLGYEKGDLTEHFDALISLIHPDDLQRVNELYSKFIRREIPTYKVELRLKHKNGHWVWIESNGKIVKYDENGNTLDLMGIHLDITERKLREIEEKLNSDRIAAQYRMSLLDDKSEEEIMSLALEEALMMTGSECGFFHFIDPDQQTILLTGWSAETTKNCKIPYVYHYPVSEAGMWANCIQTKQPFICNDYQAIDNKKGLPEGHFNLYNFISIPVIEGGLVVLVYGVGNKKEAYNDYDASQLNTFIEEVMKIIKRRRLDQELKITKEKAEESSILKSSLLMNMSHELRTPLNGILGFSSLLKDLISDDDALEMLNFINISGERLLVTLTSILEMSQLDSNYTIKHITEVNLTELLQKVIIKFNSFLSYKNILLSKNIEPGIILNTDQDMVSNIFYYIIDNAIKFTEVGQIWISLQNVEKNKVNGILFQVRDTGIGINEEQLNVIFEPFRQGSEGIGRSHEGNGLGLTLCKRFLEMLGGIIEIESKPEVGSTFSIFLFNAENQVPPKIIVPLQAENVEKQPVSKSSTLKQTILLVEDNETNVELMTCFLQDSFLVDKALTGNMAIKLCTINDYDLILMDINLRSGIDGIEASKEIRKLKRNELTPIIAVTGYATDQEKKAILSHGLNDYLAKPFTRDELLSAINRVL